MCEGLNAFFASRIEENSSTVGCIADDILFYPLHFVLQLIRGEDCVASFRQMSRYKVQKINPVSLHESNFCIPVRVVRGIILVLAVIPFTILGICVKGSHLLFSSDARKLHQKIKSYEQKKRRNDLFLASLQAQQGKQAAIDTLGKSVVRRDGVEEKKVAAAASASPSFTERDFAPAMLEIFGEEKSFFALPEIPGLEGKEIKADLDLMPNDLNNYLGDSKPALSAAVYRFKYKGVWHVYFRTISSRVGWNEGQARTPENRIFYSTHYFNYMLLQTPRDRGLGVWIAISEQGSKADVDFPRSQGASPRMGIYAEALNYRKEDPDFYEGAIKYFQKLFRGEVCGALLPSGKETPNRTVNRLWTEEAEKRLPERQKAEAEALEKNGGIPDVVVSLG